MRRSESRAALYLTFTGTGVALALPGAMLPRLIAIWQIGDSRTGLLLFTFSLGSLLGAVAARGKLHWSITRGCLLTALGGVALATATRNWAMAAIGLYGLGLGITMTSISLLQSRRHSADRAAELTRLNLIWAVGAVSAPWVVLHGVHSSNGPRVALVWVSTFFAAMGAWAAVRVEHVEAETMTASSPSSGISGWQLPLTLALMVAFSTGIESTSGSWLAAYSQRSGAGILATIGAPACFWAGLLFSRWIQSFDAIARRSERVLLTLNLWMMTLALLWLVMAGAGTGMLVAAFLVGAGIGPMYPVLLALVLRHGESGNAVFVLAGAGASLLPLLTGLISAHAGGLRRGMCVPLAAAALMAALGSMESRSKVRNTA